MIMFTLDQKMLSHGQILPAKYGTLVFWTTSSHKAQPGTGGVSAYRYLGAKATIPADAPNFHLHA
jgi:hypothetical protein